MATGLNGARDEVKSSQYPVILPEGNPRTRPNPNPNPNALSLADPLLNAYPFDTPRYLMLAEGAHG